MLLRFPETTVMQRKSAQLLKLNWNSTIGQLFEFASHAVESIVPAWKQTIFHQITPKEIAQAVSERFLHWEPVALICVFLRLDIGYAHKDVVSHEVRRPELHSCVIETLKD